MLLKIPFDKQPLNGSFSHTDRMTNMAKTAKKKKKNKNKKKIKKKKKKILSPRRGQNPGMPAAGSNGKRSDPSSPGTPPVSCIKTQQIFQ